MFIQEGAMYEEKENEKYWQGFYSLLSENPKEWLRAVKERKVEIAGDDPAPEFYLECLRRCEANEQTRKEKDL